MPKLLRLPPQTGIPGSLPYAQASPATFAAPFGALEDTSAQIAETGFRILDQKAKIDGELRKADAALEVDTAVGTLKTQFAEEQARLTSQGIHPDAYAPTMHMALEKLGRSLMGTMRYPEAQATFQRRLLQFRAEEGVKAIHKGWELKHNAIKFGEDIQQRENESAYIDTPSSENLDTLFELPTRGMGIYRTEAESRAMFAGSMTRVQRGLIDKEWQTNNPSLQQTIVTKLRKGAYPWLLRGEQTALADTLEERSRAEKKRRDEELKDARKAQADESEKAIEDALLSRNFDAAHGTLAQVRDYLTPERYAHWKDAIVKRESGEGTSDPATNKRLRLAVVEVQDDPQREAAHARAVLADAQEQYRVGRLNDKDYDHVAGAARTRITSAGDKGLSQLGRQHAQAEQLLSEALRVTGPAAPILNTAAQDILQLGLEDLTRNSAYLGKGNENPLDWADRKVHTYRARLQTVATQRIKSLEQDLRRYPDRETLKARRADFRTEADFLDAVRKLRDLELLRQEMSEVGKPSMPAGGGTRPTPTPAPGGATLGRTPKG